MGALHLHPGDRSWFLDFIGLRREITNYLFYYRSSLFFSLFPFDSNAKTYNQLEFKYEERKYHFIFNLLQEKITNLEDLYAFLDMQISSNNPLENKNKVSLIKPIFFYPNIPQEIAIHLLKTHSYKFSYSHLFNKASTPFDIRCLLSGDPLQKYPWQQFELLITGVFHLHFEATLLEEPNIDEPFCNQIISYFQACLSYFQRFLEYSKRNHGNTNSRYPEPDLMDRILIHHYTFVMNYLTLENQVLVYHNLFYHMGRIPSLFKFFGIKKPHLDRQTSHIKLYEIHSVRLTAQYIALYFSTTNTEIIVSHINRLYDNFFYQFSDRIRSRLHWRLKEPVQLNWHTNTSLLEYTLKKMESNDTIKKIKGLLCYIALYYSNEILLKQALMIHTSEPLFLHDSNEESINALHSTLSNDAIHGDVLQDNLIHLLKRHNAHTHSTELTTGEMLYHTLTEEGPLFFHTTNEDSNEADEVKERDSRPSTGP